MSDLVERLRTATQPMTFVDADWQTITIKAGPSIFDEAADEIERLTAALAEAETTAWNAAIEAAAVAVDLRAELNARERDEEGYESEDWAVLNRGVFVLQNAATAIRALRKETP
jgi:hypothetical protein